MRPAASVVKRAICASTIMLLWFTIPAAAQDRPGPVIDLTAGWVGFADDGIVSEGLIGGAARFYVTRRVSVGPEIGYIAGDNHSHFVLTANLTCDLVATTPGSASAITPFVVVGGGLFQTREQFPSGPFTSNEGAFTAGGGVRATAGDRLTLGIEGRVGWELHVRINGFVGVRLWR